MNRGKSIIFVLSISIITLTTLLLLIVFQQSQAAGFWYVAPNGNDTNDCLSPTKPCATINGAMAKPAFMNGDTVLVARGVYTGTGDAVVEITTKTDVNLKGGWDMTFSFQIGHSTIDGESKRRGIDITYETNYFNNIVNIEKFVIENCSGSGITNSGNLTLKDSIVQGNVAEYYPGGIDNSGELTLISTTVRGNKSKYNAGGIENREIVELINSTVKDNQTEGSGGGIATSVYDLFITNSTISNNSAKKFGGGIYESFAKSDRRININSSTISGNSANEGGGIYREESPYQLRVTFHQTIQNSILAENADQKGSPDCFGGLWSGGYNLIGNTSGCKGFSSSLDLTNIDAGLLPLEGVPSYHPLYRFSPAIDAGNPSGCKDHNGKPLDKDQRGVPRQGRCDIGSYEYNSERYAVFPLLFRSD